MHPYRWNPNRFVARRSHRLVPAALAALAALAAACSDASTAPPGTVAVHYDLTTEAQGWTVGFADHPVEKDSDWRLEGGVRPLPASLGGRSALYVAGENHSDDLFSFATREVTGLQPNTTYRVGFRVELATRAPAGCVGIGGSPGEAQYVKVGVAGAVVRAEPRDGEYRLTADKLTADKGNQAAGGANALVVGHLGTPESRCDEPAWAAKALDSGQETLDVTSDASGRAWLFVGVDSGFEGRTEYYVTSVRAEFTPRR